MTPGTCHSERSCVILSVAKNLVTREQETLHSVQGDTNNMSF